MSLISFSATRIRLAAWLGLLAIALLFIAPAISKSLAQTHGGSGMMMHHQMDEGHGAMMSEAAAVHSPLSMMDDSACGYCVLLVHLALGLTAVPLLWLMRRAAAPPALPLLLPVIAQVPRHFFHPRAPPPPFVSP